MLCERTECAAECLYQTPVIETLLAPVIALLNGQQVNNTHTQNIDVQIHYANMMVIHKYKYLKKFYLFIFSNTKSISYTLMAEKVCQITEAPLYFRDRFNLFT